MLRSLYSGVSGLRSEQTAMDVIGNNIANVNTTGFKSSRANFQDMVYQMVRAASAPSGGGAGSVNPSQVGTGVSVASISLDMNNGALENTGRALDLAIQGNGFFCVKDNSNNLYYTRNGNFNVDVKGDLVDENGNLVLNSAGSTINLYGTPAHQQITSISIGKDGKITALDSAGATITGINNIGLFLFKNQDGLKQVGQNYFQQTTASGTASAIGTIGSTTMINSGYLEMSNVDLAQEFTNMITTQRAYQANARTITVSDSLLQELVDLKR
ncbi:flagellar hook-basal body protein [Desulfotomaculum copahuensis]|uniref:Flagellar hook protein FlgE n=1 Tax=Desulfotomaculum copahuensis TaxID=1838280 RepID=A0A1B7LBS1_9FIRM|nr:flagellar hook-basal body complex protein [Desulfotomaculum copahuensis]OAT79928.1 flagellar basal body rod protein FlgG [Desulfotomaculum copahuensis]